MIAVDTNVLIALVEPRDALHSRATRDLKRLVRRPLVAPVPIVTEACFALPRKYQRARLQAVLQALPIRIAVGDPFEGPFDDVFSWLDRYADHVPDWADAVLAVASGRDARVRIWTYDREFASTWRRPDGSRIPLAVPSGR